LKRLRQTQAHVLSTFFRKTGKTEFLTPPLTSLPEVTNDLRVYAVCISSQADGYLAWKLRVRSTQRTYLHSSARL